MAVSQCLYPPCRTLTYTRPLSVCIMCRRGARRPGNGHHSISRWCRGVFDSTAPAAEPLPPDAADTRASAPVRPARRLSALPLSPGEPPLPLACATCVIQSHMPLPLPPVHCCPWLRRITLLLTCPLTPRCRWLPCVWCSGGTLLSSAWLQGAVAAHRSARSATPSSMVREPLLQTHTLIESLEDTPLQSHSIVAAPSMLVMRFLIRCQWPL